MPRNCFDEIKRFLNFSDSSKQVQIGEEGMISFKGRLSFRQYMPAKPTKYGIKVWMCADSATGYVLNHDVYCTGTSAKTKTKKKWTVLTLMLMALVIM